MPAVGAVVAAVASAVAAISYAVAGVCTVFTVASIVAAVASAVATIGTIIKYGLKGSITEIATAVMGIARVFVVGLKAVEHAILDQAVQYAIDAREVEALQWERLYERVHTISTAVETAIQTPYKFIEQSIKWIGREVSEAVDFPHVDFDEARVRIAEALKVVNGSIIGAITKPYVEYVKMLEILHTTAKAWEAFDNEKWGAGAYYLAKLVDLRVKGEVVNLAEIIDQKLNRVGRVVDQIIGVVSRETQILDDWLGRHQEIFLDIGRAFGAEELIEIGNKIRDYRTRVFGTFAETLALMRARTREVLDIVFDPLRSLVQQVQAARWDDARAQRLFRAISLEQLRRSLVECFFPYRYALFVPSPVFTRVRGQWRFLRI